MASLLILMMLLLVAYGGNAFSVAEEKGPRFLVRKSLITARFLFQPPHDEAVPSGVLVLCRIVSVSCFVFIIASGRPFCEVATGLR